MLNSATLKEDLAKMFGRDSSRDYPSTVQQAGQKWAEAIDTYSKGGTVNGSPVNVPGSSVSLLAQALIAGFSTLPGNPATVAQTISSALAAYWVTVTVPAQVAPPIPVGAPILVAQLMAIFTVAGGTAQTKANEIADAIDVYTKAIVYTVLVGVVPTPFNVV